MFHQHHIRAGAADLLDDFEAVTGLADHGHVALGLDDHAKAGADQRLVVGQEDTDHCGDPVSGMWARTANPPSQGPASSAPP